MLTTLIVNFGTTRDGRIIALFSLLFLSGISLAAQTTYESMRAGDAAYDRSNYSKSEPHYRRVAEKDPANWNAAYNLGNALYEQGKYEDASKIFEKAVANAPSDRAKADVLHNAGNALLKQNKFKEAIKAYEGSLRLRPGDADTKMNLQMAKKKDQQEEQQKQQQKQDQNKKQDQKQDPDNDPNQQNQNPDKDQKKQDQNNNQAPQQNQPQQPKQQQPQQQQPDNRQRMKEEEAKRLLETSIGPEDKKNARKYRSGQSRKAPAAGKKDW